jgi:hypothetical protein
MLAHEIGVLWVPTVSHVEGKYNTNDWQLYLQKVTSISIHNLGSYISYKRCHMTFVQVAEHNLPNQNKSGMRTLFSRHGFPSTKTEALARLRDQPAADCHID